MLAPAAALGRTARRARPAPDYAKHGARHARGWKTEATVARDRARTRSRKGPWWQRSETPSSINCRPGARKQTRRLALAGDGLARPATLEGVEAARFPQSRAARARKRLKISANRHRLQLQSPNFSTGFKERLRAVVHGRLRGGRYGRARQTLDRGRARAANSRGLPDPRKSGCCSARPRRHLLQTGALESEIRRAHALIALQQRALRPFITRAAILGGRVRPRGGQQQALLDPTRCRVDVAAAPSAAS